jgi:hypothetical protein
MARLFISQTRLTAWAGEDRVKVDGDLMTLSGDGRSFRLRAAVRFLKVSGPGVDPHLLVGKVKTVEALEELGGEHFYESVLLGDTAYDVQNGFLGDPVTTQGV